MSVAVAVLFLISPLISVLGVALTALVVALVVFLAGAGVTLSGSAAGALIILVAAIPTSAYLSAALSRRVLECPGGFHSGTELLSMVLAAALALRLDGGELFAASALLVSAHAVTGVVAVTISNVLFVSGLSAFVVVGVVACAELLTGWLSFAARLPARVCSAAVFQLLALLTITAAFNLLAGLISRELAPLTLVAGIF